MSAKNILLRIHRDLAAGDIKLPTLPEVSLRIKRAAVDPEVDINRLAKIAETDPAFCVYLLQISNSPLYRGAAEIQKVQLAVGRLGLMNTRNIAMSYAVRALFSFKQKNIAVWLRRVWHNSIYTAAVASIIAEHIPIVFDPDKAILGGLLQDIGCLPLIDKAGQHPELLDDNNAMLFLFDRYASNVGTAILKKWQLNSEFLDVTRNRDNWKYNEVSKVQLTDLILLAKLHTYLGQKTRTPLPRMNLVPAFVKLQLDAKLSPEQSIQFVADAKQRIDETCKALGK